MPPAYRKGDIRMKKKFILFAVLVLMLSFCSFSVSAKGGPTVEKVTRISESGILVEFSEDVVIDTKNPFFGIRLLDDTGSLLYVNGGPAQFYSLDVSVVDGKTLLLTSEQGVFKQMLEYRGTYAFYKDFHLRFCIEEMIPEGVEARGDGTVYNIKSRATGERLVATYGGPNAYDGCYCEIETDYDYLGAGGSSSDNMDDPNAEPSTDKDTQANTDDHTFITDELGEGSVSVIHEGGNENITWIALGVAAVDFVGIVAILVIILVKNKSKRRGDVK